MHPRISLAFLAGRAHCWLMVNLSSTRTPRSLSAELLSSRSTPSLYWCMALFLPRCRTLHLPLLNLIRFLFAQLSSLSRSHWTAAQPSGISTTSPSFQSSANLLRVHSNSSPQGPFLPGRFLATSPKTCSVTWDCSDRSARLMSYYLFRNPEKYVYGETRSFLILVLQVEIAFNLLLAFGSLFLLSLQAGVVSMN